MLQIVTVLLQRLIGLVSYCCVCVAWVKIGDDRYSVILFHLLHFDDIFKVLIDTVVFSDGAFTLFYGWPFCQPIVARTYMSAR